MLILFCKRVEGDTSTRPLASAVDTNGNCAPRFSSLRKSVSFHILVFSPVKRDEDFQLEQRPTERNPSTWEL